MAGFEGAKQLLKETKLGDFVARQGVRDVVTLPLGTSVGDALKTLSAHRILSAPVLDPSSGEYVGLLDVGDLLRGLLASLYPDLLPREGERPDLLPREQGQEAGKEAQEEEDASRPTGDRALHDAELQIIGPEFSARPIDSLMHGGDLWYRGDPGSTLLEVCAEGFRLALPTKVHSPRHYGRVHHRVGVFDIQPGRQTPDGPIPEWRIASVVSQSDVAALLADKGEALGAAFSTGLRDLGLGTSPPATVPGHLPALAAFARMQREDLSGLGILGAGGQLVGSISVASLRGLTPDRFGALALPVAEYVAVAAAPAQAWEDVLFGKHLPGVDAGDWARVLDKSPLACCAPGDPLAAALGAMLSAKLHRCWVTDTGARGGLPLGVVTLTDVLRRVIE